MSWWCNAPASKIIRGFSSRDQKSSFLSQNETYIGNGPFIASRTASYWWKKHVFGYQSCNNCSGFVCKKRECTQGIGASVVTLSQYLPSTNATLIYRWKSSSSLSSCRIFNNHHLQQKYLRPISKGATLSSRFHRKHPFPRVKAPLPSISSSEMYQELPRRPLGKFEPYTECLHYYSPRILPYGHTSD